MSGEVNVLNYGSCCVNCTMKRDIFQDPFGVSLGSGFVETIKPACLIGFSTR